jgi:tRNA threonylcarbamoyladenosine biosynthesis protein TsaE
LNCFHNTPFLIPLTCSLIFLPAVAKFVANLPNKQQASFYGNGNILTTWLLTGLNLRMKWMYKQEELPAIAKALWDTLGQKKVIAFHGQMGAGKTTLIHAMCEAKQVKDIVGSPTFSIINEYQFEENDQLEKIYHIDLYRLKDEEEARLAGVEDCLYSGNICLVEWPEKAETLFPSGTLHVFITLVDTETRKLHIADK